jgi:nicotinate-nucleotide adenylyltransferase
LPLAELRLMPAGQPWQKPGATAALHRVAMLEATLAAAPDELRARLRIDRSELQRQGPTYTVDTLATLRSTLGPVRPLVLVLGADQFEGLATWHEWQRLFTLAHLAVARRAGAPLAPPEALRALLAERRAPAQAVRASPAGRIVELAMHPSDASATTIRRLLRARAAGACTPQERTALQRWVPAPVLVYIDAHHLYK